ncbi:MAG TPA: PEGA domain-containing protein, partial [Polyangia bacterium]|nr:PEGA domain-containing protein [Polyangia bacterium]
MRITTAVALALLLSASTARAAARAVLLPVVVGSGGEPSAELMSALARGLQDNPGWIVVEGGALKGLMVPPAGLKEEDRARLRTKLDQAAEKLTKGGAKEAVADLEAVRTELGTAAKDLALVDADHELAYRAAGLLVAALGASGDADRAKTVAAETAVEFPGRKPRPGDKLPSHAAELLTAVAAPTGGVKLTIKTRPEGCEVFVNGTSLGKAPVEVLGSPVATYQAHAACPGGLSSYPKRIFLAEKESARQEVLDA